MIYESMMSYRFPPLSHDYLNIRDMHEYARAFTVNSINGTLSQVPDGCKVLIAIDGSGGAKISRDEDGEATWAFAVYACDTYDRFYFIGYIGGTLSQSQEFLQTVYHVAFIWALYWTLLHKDALQYAHAIEIVFDSLSAIYISSGKWSAASPRQVSAIAQALWECVINIYYITVSHINSHTGNPLNEFVDSICTTISKKEISCEHTHNHISISHSMRHP